MILDNHYKRLILRRKPPRGIEIAVFFNLFHKFIYYAVQFIQSFGIVLLDSFYDAVLHVLFEKGTAGAVELGFHGRKLYQHVGTVAAVLYHALYGFKMPDGPCYAVYYLFDLRRVVRMRMLPVPVTVDMYFAGIYLRVYRLVYINVFVMIVHVFLPLYCVKNH